ncbi:hypothetical protein Tco_0758665 [Tanacetum coccineum]
MASHRLNPLYAIKECSSCGSLYTRECCSIESLENKILVPEPDSSPCCAKCGTPVDGPYCRGCALLRKKFEEDLLTYYVENGIFQDSQDTFESSDNNTNVINAIQKPIVVNQDPGVKSSQDENSFIYDSKPHSFNVSPSVLTYPLQLQFETYLCELCGNNAHYGYDCSPQFPFVYEQEPCYNDNYFPQNFQSSSQQYLCCVNCGGPHETFQCQPMNEEYYEQNSCYDFNSFGFDQPQPPQDSVDHQKFQQALDKIQELKEIKRDRRKKIEDMSIKEMRHEQQLVDYKIKEITNDLGYKIFHGEKIDEGYERDCDIRIRKLKQDFNEWGSEVRKKEQAYNEEQYSAARCRMLSIPFVDEDDYIPLGDIIARYSTLG